LCEGDIIMGLAGEVASAIDDLQRVLTEDRIGERVEAVVLRDGRRVTAQIVPAETAGYVRLPSDAARWTSRRRKIDLDAAANRNEYSCATRVSLKPE